MELHYTNLLIVVAVGFGALPFIVAATAIGRDIGVITAANQAALIAAGLVSVLVFPALGLALLKREASGPAPAAPPVISTTKEAVS
jgi:hypothetical protein